MNSYYGSDYAKKVYNSLYKLYENQGLSNSEIDKILVLDVKGQKYFIDKGYSYQHAGENNFATDETIMNLIFLKVKN